MSQRRIRIACPSRANYHRSVSTTSAASSEEPNQAGEDGATPFDFVEHVYGRKAPRSARSFLAIMISALRLVHESSPSLSYVLAGLQLIGGVIAAGQVLLAKVVLGGIIHATNANGSVGSVLPALVALVGTMALSTLSGGVTTQLQVMLTELVTRHTWRRILAVTTGVRLERFESPAFFDELQRVQANALIRPLSMAQGLLASVSGVFSVAGLSVALLIIKPVLLPLLLAAGCRCSSSRAAAVSCHSSSSWTRPRGFACGSTWQKFFRSQRGKGDPRLRSRPRASRTLGGELSPLPPSTAAAGP